MTETQKITGKFRRRGQTFGWNLALSSSILVGGGMVILLLLYQRGWLALGVALIAMCMAAIAMWQIQKRFINLEFDGVAFVLKDQQSNIITALTMPFQFEVGIRHKTTSKPAPTAYLQLVVYHQGAAIILEEKLTDDVPQLPSIKSHPATVRYGSYSPNTDLLWTLVQRLGIPKNPLIKELILPDVDEENSQSLFEIGKAQFARYEIDAAIETFSRWASINPDSPIAFYNLGIARLESNLAQAIEDFSKAIQRDEQFLGAYKQRAKAYATSKQWEACLNDALYLLKFETDAELYNLCGVAYHALDQVDKAREYYTQAIIHQPDFARAYYNRGILLQQTGDAERAHTDLERARTLDPGIQRN